MNIDVKQTLFKFDPTVILNLCDNDQNIYKISIIDNFWRDVYINKFPLKIRQNQNNNDMKKLFISDTCCYPLHLFVKKDKIGILYINLNETPEQVIENIKLILYKRGILYDINNLTAMLLLDYRYNESNFKKSINDPIYQKLVLLYQQQHYQVPFNMYIEQNYPPTIFQIYPFPASDVPLFKILNFSGYFSKNVSQLFSNNSSIWLL